MSRSRQVSTFEALPGLAPSEWWVMAQTSALAIYVSWAFGGVVRGTETWLLLFALGGLGAVGLRWRETGRVAVWPWVPALLWAGLVALAVANPSHTPAAGGGWVPRAEWVRWLPTTADVGRTLADGQLWLAVFVQGGVLATAVRSPAAARVLWAVVALNGFALAATGAFFHFDRATAALGHFRVPEAGYFFATFFYKNHWAAFGALTTGAALALAARSWRLAVRGDPVSRGKALLFGGAGLLTAVTLPLPGSRAGLLLAAVLVVAFGGWAARAWWRSGGPADPRERWALRAVAGLTAAILVYGAIAYAPRGAVDLQRTQREVAAVEGAESMALRLQVSRDTARMALARPWFGWGPGTFEIVFPVYHGAYLRGPDGRPTARFEFAHNDWLQLPAEVGVIGAVIFLGPAAVLAGRAWRRGDGATRLGVLGCGLVAVHAAIDFPFRNPAVALTWVVLLATAPRLRAGDGGRRPEA
jgi:O-antigen ligase